MTDETTTPAAPSAPAADPTTNIDAAPEQHQTSETPANTETEGQAPETQAEGQEPDAEDQEPKKKPSGSQRLKRRLSAVESEYLELQRRNEELEARLKGSAPSNSGKPGIDREPAEADFPNDYFAYERAMNAWHTRQAIREELSQREAATRQKDHDRLRSEYHQERIEVLHELAETARERIPDFDKVVNSAASLQVSQELADEVLASDKSALLQYHLAKNPDKVRELNGMTGRELAREIGRLEARVHLPTSRKATQADPPPSQPRGGAAPPVNLATADMDTYVALRRKQMGKA